MGRIAIITDDPGWHGKRLRDAFAGLGFDSYFVSLTRCRIALEAGCIPVQMPGFEQQLPDAVFVRGIPGGSLEQVIFYLNVLHILKASGVPVYNDGRVIECSVDKAMTSFLLGQAGVASPATWVVASRERARAIAERELGMGHQLVSKPLFGSQGIGLQHLQTKQDLLNLAGSHGIYYLQRFIAPIDGHYQDWRVFVIQGRSIAAMRRCGDGWLNNVAQGAQCEAVVLSDVMAQLAEQAVEVLHMNYAGVDIMQDAMGRTQVIEVNSIPAWKGLQSVCQLDIAAELAADLYQHYLSPVSQNKRKRPDSPAVVTA